jgi:predicted Ser/Thr protein kinase
MSTCIRCSGFVAPDARFCPACGAEQHTTGQEKTALESSAPSRGPADREIGGFAPGQILAERYRIVGLLGKGGMGEVYRADDLKLGQVVALKFLPEELARDEAALERFRAEVRTARQVSHPNVCRVYDIGESDGRQFLTMEYVDGEDLAGLLRRIGRLPGGKALDVARQLCAGLAAIHDRGVLHRDLKPANVMLDGHGRVRITDFGVARLAGEVPAGELAGTLVYMAPELFEGRPYSVQSDLFALGLVLYEACTGERAFDAGTLDELREKHTHSSPTTPSQVQADVDAALERAIVRCLEKDPSRRPPSVRAVAAALPGGDPLAAALAAGETPSPGMVAAAGGEGALAPRIAWALLGTTVAFILACVLISPYSTDLGLASAEKGPEVLADRARGIAAGLGYTQKGDTATWFDRWYDPMKYLADHKVSTVWRREMGGWGPPLLFRYRQSPLPLIPGNSDGIPNLGDPPRRVSGMVNVTLDAKGRLHALEAVPPQFEKTPNPATPPDWRALFTDAGLDLTKFTATSPQWLSPQPFDVRGEWTGALPWARDIPVRVSAAAYRGRPVYFEILGPWSLPTRMSTSRFRATARFRDVVLSVVLAALLAAAIVFARRNLRAGRGDRHGALVLAVALGAVSFVWWVLSAHHVLDFSDEFGLFFKSISDNIFVAAFLALLYLAVEPYVRRTMPEVLIGWARVVEGRYRDPRVGRDLLIGAASGAVAIFAVHLANGLPAWIPLSGQTPFAFGGYLWPPAGARGVLFAVVNTATGAMGLSLIALGLLFVFRLIVRRTWLAAVLLALVLALIGSWGENLVLDALANGVTCILIALVLSRFGLVAGFGFFAMEALLRSAPLPMDSSAWYFGSSVALLALALALVLYAFRVSLGPRPVFVPAEQT